MKVIKFDENPAAPSRRVPILPVLLAVCVVLGAGRTVLAQGAPISGTAAVSLSPNSFTVPTSNFFTVNLFADVTGLTGKCPANTGATQSVAVGGYDIPITFDQTRVQLVSVTSCSGEPVTFPSGPSSTALATANASGEVTVAATQSSSHTSPTGNVCLATLNFQATTVPGGFTLSTLATGGSLNSTGCAGQTGSANGPQLIPYDAGGASVTICDPPTAVAGTSGNTTVICGSGSVTLQGSGGGSGGSCLWTWIDNFGSHSSSLCSLTTSPTVTTTYGLTVFNSSGCPSTNGAGVTITVIPVSTPPIVTPPSPIIVTQTSCSNHAGGTTGNATPAVATFLNGDTAISQCGLTLTRLSPLINGNAASNSTFITGVTTVTFRWRDSSNTVGTATSTISVRQWGDVSGDFAVNSVDATILLNYVNGNIQSLPVDLTFADVNGDGFINSVDVTDLLNFLVGNIACLPTN